MKPLFTVHAGEFPVDCEIERKFRRVNVWIPAKDTGIDLLVSNNENTTTVSLQVKFSRDYLVTHLKDAALHRELRACGWWTPTRQQIHESRAKYWVFVLVGFANRSTDFIIIKPNDLLERLDIIHKGKTPSPKKLHTYLGVTKHGKCYETRNLNRSDQTLIAEQHFGNDARDFTKYLNITKHSNDGKDIVSSEPIVANITLATSQTPDEAIQLALDEISSNLQSQLLVVSLNCLLHFLNNLW